MMPLVSVRGGVISGFPLVLLICISISPSANAATVGHDRGDSIKRRLPYLIGGIRYKRYMEPALYPLSEAAAQETAEAEGLEPLREALEASGEERDLAKRALDYLYGGVRYRRRSVM
ncbi:neuropeptide [Echinococcus multilocularis]|uniref:Neuropeptide n=1 Tax=Echinococcus multilocularis TaxID=6211 RepID=A0A068Y2T7_ECHMU|nr:neuropeptide [Echinococcus multilocularis]